MAIVTRAIAVETGMEVGPQADFWSKQPQWPGCAYWNWRAHFSVNTNHCKSQLSWNLHFWLLKDKFSWTQEPQITSCAINSWKDSKSGDSNSRPQELSGTSMVPITNQALSKSVNWLIQVGHRRHKMHFLITDYGEDEIVLGYPWLAAFQLCINVTSW